MTPLLAVHGLAVEYATGAGIVRAVDGVDLGVAPGESVGLVGESGSGKSTLARAVLQLVRPCAGRIEWQGADLARLAPGELRRLRRHLQVVFQHPTASLSPRRTIGQSVGEPLALHEPGLGAAELERRVAAMLARVGLAPALAARRPHELSGGQCQRAAIARAMLTGPRLVVCDEPVSALDVSVQAQVINLLDELGAELGTAYLFISHNLAVVRRIATRVVVLYRGRVVEAGPRAALFEDAQHPYTRLLIDSVPSLRPSAARAAAAAVPAETASPFARPSGCGYAGRCPHAQARCREAAPPLEPVAAGHEVACWRWREGVAAPPR